MEKRLGMVVVFKEGVTEEQVANWLSNHSKHPNAIIDFDATSVVPDKFNPDHGFPVFYVP